MRSIISSLVIVVAMAYSMGLSAADKALNRTAIELCTDVLFNCTGELYNTTDDYACMQPFAMCMYQNAYSPGQYKECYMADGAWASVRAVSALAGGAFVMGVFAIPISLKLYARWVNKIAKYDAETHPYLSRMGKFLVKIHDSDNNGEITAKEIVEPQIAYGIVGVGFLASLISHAYDLQALCDYENSLPPH